MPAGQMNHGLPAMHPWCTQTGTMARRFPPPPACERLSYSRSLSLTLGAPPTHTARLTPDRVQPGRRHLAADDANGSTHYGT